MTTVNPTIDMVLHCPRCGMQHIDTPSSDWANPPHRSHLCAACGFIWRPADVCTNGVTRTKTHGWIDTPTLPVVVLLRHGPQRAELHPLVVHEGQLVSGVSADARVGRERYAVYAAPPGSGHLLLVLGYGEHNVVSGCWTLKRNSDGTAYAAHDQDLKAELLGFVEDQMEYVSAFGGTDSEDTPHYTELLAAFRAEMDRRNEPKTL